MNYLKQDELILKKNEDLFYLRKKDFILYKILIFYFKILKENDTIIFYSSWNDSINLIFKKLTQTQMFGFFEKRKISIILKSYYDLRFGDMIIIEYLDLPINNCLKNIDFIWKEINKDIND